MNSMTNKPKWVRTAEQLFVWLVLLPILLAMAAAMILNMIGGGTLWNSQF